MTVPLPLASHRRRERQELPCEFISGFVVTFSLIPSALAWWSPRLKSWVYQQKECSVGCWHELGKVHLRQADVPLPQPKIHFLFVLWPPRWCAWCQQGCCWPHLGALALLEGKVVQSSSFIRAARGQASRNCKEGRWLQFSLLSLGAPLPACVLTWPPYSGWPALNPPSVLTPGHHLLLLSLCWFSENSAIRHEDW